MENFSREPIRFSGSDAAVDLQGTAVVRRKAYRAMQPGWSGLEDIVEVCRKFNSLPAAQGGFSRGSWARPRIDSDQVLKVYFNLKE